MKTQRQWRTFDGKRLKLSITDEVENVLAKVENAKQQITVCIGTDSQVFGGKINYATVVVFYRQGKGGFMYISNNKQKAGITIKERMLSEVTQSIEVAFELVDLLVQHNVDMEIHADINTSPNFKSNTALRDAMGYIMGCGFIFKAKPFAYASSSCANKWTR